MKLNKISEIHFWLFILGTIILFLGLVCSKALISIGSVVIILSGLIKLGSDGSTLIWKNKQVIGFGLLLLAPLLSGIWSESMRDWFQVISNKIILPALFGAILLAPRFSSKIYIRLSLLQLLLVVLASFYSIGPLMFKTEIISKSYLQAKTLHVLLSNDHLHFSLYVFISLVVVFFLLDEIKAEFGKKTHYLAIGMSIWLIIYLHILGAKTGLLLLYGSFIYYWIKTYLIRGQRSIVMAGLVLAIVIGIISIKTIPTLQNRVHYTLYDFNQYIHGAYVDGLTDGARVLSWKARMDVANQFPFLGVGFGDMNTIFTSWHQTHSSHLQTYNWLQPSNEWLMYLCGSGIFGVICITLGFWLIYNYSPIKKSLLFKILFFSQLIMMWYEVNLTNQTGIAIFAFFLGWVQIKNRFETDPA